MGEYRDWILIFAAAEIGGLGPTYPTRDQLDKYVSWSGLGYPNWDAACRYGGLRERWCGLFAVYCLRASGLLGIRWGMVPELKGQWAMAKSSDEYALSYDKTGMQPGDVVVIDNGYSHHVICKEPDDSGFTALQGNYGWSGANPLTNGCLAQSWYASGSVMYYYSLNID
jgi:hypothetical protein